MVGVGRGYGVSQQRNFKRTTGTVLFQDNTFRPTTSPLTYYLKIKFSLEFAHRMVEEVAFAWQVYGPPP